MDIIELLHADRDQETALEVDHPQCLPTENVIDSMSSENEDDDLEAGVDCAGEQLGLSVRRAARFPYVRNIYK